MQPQTLKESDSFIILNKPAGLVVHPDGRTEESTLCDWILENYPEIEGVGEPLKLENGATIDRPGIVHRLDRETSGIMVVARTQKGFEYLKQQFQDQKVEKTYHTIVYGNIKEDRITIDEPIGRSKKDFRQWFSGKKTRGKTREAITEFKILKRSTDKNVTLIEASPKTGRTHQIRVHLKSIYHPIVCDSLYAPDRDCLFGLNRTALHSKSIKFTAPAGDTISAEALYPDDFERAISLIK